MKLLLFTGLEALEEIIERQSQCEHELTIIDSFEQLELDAEDAEAVIINRYMDESETGEQLQRVIRRMRQSNKNLRLAVLLDSPEKEFIQAMVSVGIFDMVICSGGEDLEAMSSKLLKAIETPAISFNFDLLKEKEPEADLQRNKKTVQSDSEEANWSIRLKRRPFLQTAFKEVIAVYSPSGSGATTTALNLGVALTESKKCKVLVMGLDLMNSVMDVRLKKTPIISIYQLVDSHKKKLPLSEIIEDAVTAFGKVDVMPGSFDLNEYYYLGEADLWRLIRDLQKIYDYIVLDISAYLTDKVTASAMQKASRVYLVSEATSSHLEHLQRYRTTIKERFPSVNLRGVIINKYTGASLTSIEIETIMGQKPVAIITDNKHLTAVDSMLNRKRIAKVYKGLIKDVIN